MSASSFGQTREDGGSAEQDIIFLANLMKHSDVVIQSRGSLALDAIAFDTPVISIGFDGDCVRLPEDSFLWEYAFDHYKPLVAADGTWLVGSYDALDKAIRGYLRNPGIHSAGRKAIREKSPIRSKSRSSPVIAIRNNKRLLPYRESEPKVLFALPVVCEAILIGIAGSF